MTDFTSVDSISKVFIETEEFRDYPLRPLFTLCSVYAGEAIASDDLSDEKIVPVYGSNGIRAYTDKPNHLEDQVLVGRQGSVGTVHFAKAPFWAAEHALVVEPRTSEVSKQWLKYVLETLDLSRLSRAVAQPGINASSVSFQRVPTISLGQQKAIADYLDRETAEIDAAVADLDRYMDLLEQRRLLTVDEVLYFLKAAASEWPEMSLKFIIKERFVGDWGEETGTADIDAPCVRVADFDRPTNTVGDQVSTIRSYSLDKYEAKRLRHHDILVERSGGGEKTPVGSAMLYTGGDEVLCANFIEVVRLKEDQLPEYWVHVLRREYMGRNTMRFVKQTTGIQNLDPQGFYDQKFPVPSLDTQIKLANELRERTSKIDYLIAEAKKLRDLLLKRRSVLITEVVTGRKQV